MRKKRHAVIRISWPPDFTPAAPSEIPPSIVHVPRLALGEAAAVAVRLNAAEMAKPASQRGSWFLAVKTMEQRPTPAAGRNDTGRDKTSRNESCRSEGRCPVCRDVRLVDGFCVRCQQSFPQSLSPRPNPSPPNPPASSEVDRPPP